jgi:hypothetical protein
MAVLAGSILLSVSSLLSAQNLPTLPQAFVDTAYAPPGGQAIAVPDGGDFQAALDSARPGDVITLAAGATYAGNFTLRNKPGSDWITIRSSASDASLPVAGTRITPTFARFLPKLVTNVMNTPVVHAETGAHHYRFIGLEFAGAPDVPVWNLVELGNGTETSATQLPHDIVIDRCYLHGAATGNTIRGVALNSARSAVIDSYFADFHAIGIDSQAIGAWAGPGPFKIVNNFLEGAGENVLFGGADPSIAGLIPSDIEFRRNTLSKPFRWKKGDPTYAGIQWSVKNIFELKNARRVLVDGNTFDGNWTQGQAGFAILFTPRNQEGKAPWSAVTDVTFTNNVLLHSDQGFNISGRDNNFPSGRTERVLVKNNLIYLVGGRLLQLVDGTTDVTFEHNTSDNTGETVVNADGAAHTRFTFRNNIVSYGTYGIFGSNAGSGNAAVRAYFPGSVIERNAFGGAAAPRAAATYPPDNVFLGSLDDVGFVDRPNRNYRLRPSSQFTSSATNGTSLGADLDAMGRDPMAPTVSISAPPPGVVSGTVVVSAAASDNAGVAGVQFMLDGVPLGAEKLAAPWAVSWNTSGESPGSHTLTAVARDTAGNATVSDSVAVIVMRLPR